MPKVARRLAVLSSASVVALLLVGTVLWHPTHVFAAGTPVSVWLTTTDGQNTITPQSGLNFAPGGGSAASTITVNENQQLQQITGFGAAMTDTSAFLIGTKMSTSQRNAVMTALFDPTNGIGLSFVRIPMGSSDFTATPPTAPAPYSYDDEPSGQTDPTLANFSITHDLSYIVPTLKQALQLNPNLTYMANPWSPPAWMKTNDSMLGGSLNASSFGPLAQYFVKFLQAYQGQGIPVAFITPQNEPTYPTNYSSMTLSATDEASFIKNNLGPALAAAHLTTKILAWDEGDGSTSYPETVLGDATANQYVSGIGWHCYDGQLQNMTTVHNAYPTKDNYETECSTGPTGIAPYSAIDVALTATQNWAKGAELWNIALDTSNDGHGGGGPKMGTGCGGCTGLVTIDQATGNATFTQNYYQLGQVSKFVVPGAYHIASSTGDGNLNNAAFKNPDGSKVLVVHNTSSSASDTFNVSWNSTQSFTYTLPAGGIVTFKWSGNPIALSSGYAINAGGSGTGAFSGDGNYSGGQTYATTASINTSGVTNPAPQAVYQTERYGNFTYTLPDLLPGAQYTVRLHFAEIYWTSSSQRLFNVAINGSQVLTNFDIFAAAGGENIALVKSFTATADSNGTLTIQFTTVKDNAKVSGIEVNLASYAINAGGSASGTFVADAFSNGGQTYATTASINTSGVTNPAPQAVYQTERYGSLSYVIPGMVAGKSYTVRLHFAEIYWTASGQRLFNVAINGTQVLTNFDVFATAGGKNIAIVEPFTATADSSGQITIQLTSVVDNAKISGIEILPA
jgi:glucosylceramidase